MQNRKREFYPVNRGPDTIVLPAIHAGTHLSRLAVYLRSDSAVIGWPVEVTWPSSPAASWPRGKIWSTTVEVSRSAAGVVGGSPGRCPRLRERGGACRTGAGAFMQFVCSPVWADGVTILPCCGTAQRVEPTITWLTVSSKEIAWSNDSCWLLSTNAITAMLRRTPSVLPDNTWIQRSDWKYALFVDWQHHWRYTLIMMIIDMMIWPPTVAPNVGQWTYDSDWQSRSTVWNLWWQSSFTDKRHTRKFMKSAGGE